MVRLNGSPLLRAHLGLGPGRDGLPSLLQLGSETFQPLLYRSVNESLNRHLHLLGIAGCNGAGVDSRRVSSRPRIFFAEVPPGSLSEEPVPLDRILTDTFQSILQPWILPQFRLSNTLTVNHPVEMFDKLCFINLIILPLTVIFLPDSYWTICMILCILLDNSTSYQIKQGRRYCRPPCF